MGGGGLIVYLYGLCLCFTVLVVGTAVGLVLFDRFRRRRSGKGPPFVSRTLPVRPSARLRGEDRDGPDRDGGGPGDGGSAVP